MRNIFPASVGMSQVRGVIKLIKENDGAITFSELASESEEDVDDMLPLVDACKMLKLVEVRDSTVKLTERGARLAISSPFRVIREGLNDVEPFKSMLAFLSKKSKTTPEVLRFLASKGFLFHEQDETNVALTKRLLRNWGVRSKLLAYDERNDSWSARM